MTMKKIYAANFNLTINVEKIDAVQVVIKDDTAYLFVTVNGITHRLEYTKDAYGKDYIDMMENTYRDITGLEFED